MNENSIDSHVLHSQFAEVVGRCNRKSEKIQIERDLLEEHFKAI